MTYPSGVKALKPLSLAFPAGEFVVILGLSGAGKSTLLRCVNHLVVPSEGVVVSGSLGPVLDKRTLQRHRRSIGMVFQHHQLLDRRSALQNVLLGRLAHHGFWRSLLPLPEADVRLAVRCLERVGLGDKLFSRVDQLSGGQRQRVGIARALAQQPQIVLADEPVASLDPATAQHVMSILAAICREDGLTALVALHQLDLARRFASRIVGLAQASVVFDGPPDQLTETDIQNIYASGPAGPATPAKSQPSSPASAANIPEEIVL